MSIMRAFRYLTVLCAIYTPLILTAIWWFTKSSPSRNSHTHYVEAEAFFDPQEFDYSNEETSNSSDDPGPSIVELSKRNRSISINDNEVIFPNKKDLKVSSSNSNIDTAVSTSDFLIAARFNSEANINSSACVSELPLLGCDSMGFAGLLLATLDHLVFCSIHNAIPTVLWKNCGAVCSNNSFFNSWEWYFEPVNAGVEKRVQNVICLAGSISSNRYPVANEELFSSWWNAHKTFGRVKKTQFTPKPLLNLSFQRRNLPGFKGFGTISRDVRFWAYTVLKKYVHVRKNILTQVDAFYKEHMSGHNVLGVHIRGTDHWAERIQHDLVPLTTWFKKAKMIFKSMQKPRKIFIASDSVEAIKYFLKRFGKSKVTFINAIRAKAYSGAAVHDSGLSPQRIGSEVLKDILLLTKCQHFLHGESSVAALASYFKPTLTCHWVEENMTGAKRATSSSGEAAKRNNRRTQNVTSTDKKHKKFSEEIETARHHKLIIDRKAEFLQALRCFKRNSPYSSCSNFKKGSFIKPEEIPVFFNQYSYLPNRRGRGGGVRISRGVGKFSKF